MTVGSLRRSLWCLDVTPFGALRSSSERGREKGGEEKRTGGIGQDVRVVRRSCSVDVY